MPTKDGLQSNYVKRFMVLSRVDGCRNLGEAPLWEDAGMFESNSGGNERQEHRFKRPRDARYVRIVGRLIQCGVQHVSCRERSKVSKHVSCREWSNALETLVVVCVFKS